MEENIYIFKKLKLIKINYLINYNIEYNHIIKYTIIFFNENFKKKFNNALYYFYEIVIMENGNFYRNNY